MTPRNDPTLHADTLRIAEELGRRSEILRAAFLAHAPAIQAADSETIDYRLAEAEARCALILLLAKPEARITGAKVWSALGAITRLTDKAQAVQFQTGLPILPT